MYFLKQIVSAISNLNWGSGIDPDMALTPLPSSIGQGSNPLPSDCEPSALLLDHSFRYNIKIIDG